MWRSDQRRGLKTEISWSRDGRWMWIESAIGAYFGQTYGLEVYDWRHARRSSRLRRLV